jgi:metal-sulfur cluster biosynthetic enzyme
MVHPGFHGTLHLMVTEEQVRDALNLVEDPELMMGIVEFTLTSMGCPVGPWIAEQVDATVRGLDGVEDVESELVFTPPWNPDMMSEDAKFVLGF